MQSKEANARSRNWFSTIYDQPFDEQLTKIKEIAKFYAGQIEEGDEKHKEHLQIFINLPQPQRRSYLHKLFPQSHFEIAKNVQASIEYCTKQETRIRGPFTNGINPIDRQEKSFKITLKDALNKSEEELQLLSPYMYITIKKAIAIIPGQQYKCDHLRGIWIHGKPGCGKSLKAFKQYPDAYRKAQNKWWDGYQGQKAVILDDFDLAGGQTLSHYIKIWTDYYPCIGEIKGGHVQLAHEWFIITSNYTPKEIWSCPILEEAITRRFQFDFMT